MKKKLGIVTLSSDMGYEYKLQLQKVFKDTVTISTYSFEKSNFDDMEGLDVLLVSTDAQYDILKKIEQKCSIVIARLTLSKHGYNLMKSLKGLNRALLVNLTLEMSLETIALLYQLGFDNTRFVPTYPSMKTVPDVDVAITTGEKNLVPKGVKTVYDLGHRLLDKNTIVELAIHLDCENLLQAPNVTEYFNTIVSYELGVDYLLNQSNVLSNQLNTLLRMMDKGVIGIDKHGVIQSCNGSAEKIIKKRSRDLVGTNIQNIIPTIDFNNECIKNRLVRIGSTYISVSVFKTGGVEDSFSGAYIVVEDFESQESTQNALRLQLMSKGHVAKYHIDHIIGNSEKICEVRSLIKRLGKSNSSVLITGESGTGKELVAQAIHNVNSNNKHFVAINCAALSSSLLESELFGYESGAFTGATKKGKQGIFEMAHNGTLFLDEIGEIPLELQAKLLRVLQEHEIMRVGGDKIIKVNVRLIAATNTDILTQVKNGLFRSDLYYRINVLPINIPPLRERKEDILTLIEYFQQKNGYSFMLNQETQTFLENYNWYGNVRELMNCLEYIDNIEKQLINVEDIPHYMKSYLKDSSFKEDTVELDNMQKAVLHILYKAYLNKEKLGRISISNKAYQQGIHLSEYDVKSIMVDLAKFELIRVSKGRGGSVISKKGITYIKDTTY